MPKQYNDIPVDVCGLDRKAWVKNIVEYIKDADAPKTILIQINKALGGDFKNGIAETGKPKSSNVQTPNGETKLHIKTVWFEAWKYQNEANIVKALLFEIREQLSAFVKIKTQIKNEALATLTGLLQSIDMTFQHSANAGVYSAGASLSLNNPVKNMNEQSERIKERRLSQPLPTFTLQKMLREAIDQLIRLSAGEKIKTLFGAEKPITKLVIIIDDLDRCEPEVAFAIFEAMKLYLNFDNCIFLLGIDQKAIERIIELKYEKENTKATSKLYLEKIVQDIFHIPLLDKDRKVKYFEDLAGNLNSLNNLVYVEILKHLNEFDLLPPIPRSIKIFVNTLFAILESKKELGQNNPTKIKPGEVKALVVVTYLYAYHYEDCLYGIILPYLPNEKTVKPIFKRKLERENELLAEKFPINKLRQVFWIRHFISQESDNLEFDNVNKFKF